MHNAEYECHSIVLYNIRSTESLNPDRPQILLHPAMHLIVSIYIIILMPPALNKPPGA